MKADTTLDELFVVKERLAEAAGDDTGRFLDQMDAWLQTHPVTGPLVESPAAWKAMRQTGAEGGADLMQQPPYRIHNPVIAELHRHRARRALELPAEKAAQTVREQPPEYGKSKE